MTFTRNNIALTVLGIVATGAILYFIYIFLAPSGAIPVQRRPLSTELKTEVLTDKVFRSLQKSVELPITAKQVGWPNPFESLADRQKF